MKILIDAFGGDNAPDEIIAGTIPIISPAAIQTKIAMSKKNARYNITPIISKPKIISIKPPYLFFLPKSFSKNPL